MGKKNSREKVLDEYMYEELLERDAAQKKTVVGNEDETTTCRVYLKTSSSVFIAIIVPTVNYSLPLGCRKNVQGQRERENSTIPCSVLLLLFTLFEN